MATREEADEHVARLRAVVEVLEGEEAGRREKGLEELEERFPFELVTQHASPQEHAASTAEADDDLTLWIIDCFHPRFIAILFRFIRTHIYTTPSTQPDKLDIKHLKAIKPTPPSVAMIMMGPMACRFYWPRKAR